MAKKQRHGAYGKLDKEISEELLDNNVSTEEGTAGAGLTNAEWNNNIDITEDTHLYLSKFTSFLKMVEQLELKHGCQRVGETRLRKLPCIKGFTKHKLSTDHNPRIMAVAELIVEEKTIHLFDVDISDMNKSFSIQILMMKDQKNGNKNIFEIEKELVTSSIRWPTALIKELCGGRNKRVYHLTSPKNKRGSINPADISKWSDRVLNHIKNL